MTLWTPDLLPDASCWLDASDSNSITLSGSSISLWEDKVGSNDANDAVNAANIKITTARPTIVSGALNSLDVIDFNGSQWFDHNTARGLLRNRSHALMVAVMKFGTINNSVLQFAWTNRNASTGTRAIRFMLLHNNTNSFRSISRRLDTDTINAEASTSSDPPFNTSYHIHIASCSWVTGNFEYWIDGTQVGTDTYSTNGNTSDTDHGTSASTWTAIGAARRDGGGGGQLSSGSRIAELFCGAKTSGSYTSSSRELLEGYAAWKWGLEANLPVGHPYENAAPTISSPNTRRRRYTGGYGL